MGAFIDIPTNMSFLKVSGTKIVDGNGKETILRGAGLGGWMNMENFINGMYGLVNKAGVYAEFAITIRVPWTRVSSTRSFGKSHWGREIQLFLR